MPESAQIDRASDQSDAEDDTLRHFGQMLFCVSASCFSLNSQNLDVMGRSEKR